MHPVECNSSTIGVRLHRHGADAPQNRRPPWNRRAPQRRAARTGQTWRQIGAQAHRRTARGKTIGDDTSRVYYSSNLNQWRASDRSRNRRQVVSGRPKGVHPHRCAAVRADHRMRADTGPGNALNHPSVCRLRRRPSDRSSRAARASRCRARTPSSRTRLPHLQRRLPAFHAPSTVTAVRQRGDLPGWRCSCGWVVDGLGEPADGGGDDGFASLQRGRA